MAAALLLGAAPALAQYNPTNPAEPDSPVVTPPTLSYTLTVAPSHEGCCSVYGGGTYTSGTRVRVYCNSIKTYYTFVNWTNSAGEVVSTAADFYYYTTAQNDTLTANFNYNFNPATPSEPDEPAVTPPAATPKQLTVASSHPDCCSVYGGGSYNEGTRVHVYCNGIKTYYTFVNWTNSAGEVVSTAADFYYYTTGVDETLTANFNYNFTPSSPSEPDETIIARNFTLRLTADPVGKGTFNITSPATYAEGANVSAVATPATNYEFVNWTDSDGKVVAETRTHAFTMPSADYELTAHFKVNYVPSNPGEPDEPDTSNTIDPDKVYGPRIVVAGPETVAILCETDGAEIWYTIDGSIPEPDNPTAKIYTGAFTVEENVVVRAIAYRAGMKDSQITQTHIDAFCCEAPDITYGAKRMVYMTCATSGATIYYTSDYTDPEPGKGTTRVYTEPILPSGDTRFKAMAVLEGLGDSEITPYAYRLVEHTATTPVFTYNAEAQTLTITSQPEGVDLHMTFDGSQPTLESETHASPYTMPVEGNMHVIAYAETDDIYPSEISERRITGFELSDPIVTWSDRKIHMSCPTEGAEIRYTTDGSVPTETSTLYTAPFLPTQDQLLTVRAFRTNYEPSATATYDFILADVTTSTPTFSREGKTLLLTCLTTGAKTVCLTERDLSSYPEAIAVVERIINQEYDGLDLLLAAASRFVYTEPLALTRNDLFYAVSIGDNMLPSDLATYEVTDFVVGSPYIYYSKKQLGITCDREDAEIRYTLDGSEPTLESTLYAGPFLPENSCTVRAVAWLSPEVRSDEDAYDFDREEHLTPAISFRPDYQQGVLYVDTDYISLFGNDYVLVKTEGADDLIRTAGDDNLESIAIDVKQIDGRARIEAHWHSDELFERESEIFEAVRAEAPTFSYDGRMLEITHTAVATGGTECSFMSSHYEMLVNSPSKVDILAPGTATFVNWGNGQFVSPEAHMDILYFHDGNHTVTLDEAGHLEDAFRWNPELAGTSAELIVNSTHENTQLNDADIRFLKTMSELRSLDIKETVPLVKIDDLSGLSKLQTVSLPEESGVQYGAAFEGCADLTRVVWNSPMRMPEELVSSIPNPNAIIESRTDIPMTYNVLVGDRMAFLRLEAGYPFRPASAFTAEEARFIKTFDRETKIGAGEGWETICVPFDVADIEHDEKGDVAPFGSDSAADSSKKRFWLAQPTGTQWSEARVIKALQPYIIAVPNSREYVHAFNLNGTLTFSNSNVLITTDAPAVLTFTDSNGDTRHFGASFTGVDAASDVFTLADGATFRADGNDANPFECYFDGTSGSRAIRIAGDKSGIDELPVDGEVTEFRFAGAAGDPQDPVFNAAGMQVGTRADLPDLAPGLYFCAGKKVVKL